MKQIQLYDYQTEMKQRIESVFISHRSAMVQMPTGTGKTYLLAACVYDWVKRNESTVWIVAHRRELIQQIKDSVEQIMESMNEHVSGNLSDKVKVMSIQWLSQHDSAVKESPGLIVIDEAHHAVAKTYTKVIYDYPKAKILGVTATPCRLTKHGFTDIFDILLQSWTTNRFIAEGRLSLYDYMSIKIDSEEQKNICSLKKRGSDGDFSIREMSDKLDVRPSLQRLCNTVLKYAANKKGIVYAIDINHAEHIAEYYSQHGIKSVVISSKTPDTVRKQLLKRFKDSDAFGKEVSSDTIQVLVNVDLFSEGFDCPDVEFIQLARPTLSLAKYLQQVGRGMRVFEGKRYCLILDNVGLFHIFGLPSDNRDWQAMFEGKISGKGNLKQVEEYFVEMPSLNAALQQGFSPDERTEMVSVMTHDGQRHDLDEAYGYKLVMGVDGSVGVSDKDGKEILPCIYRKIELKLYGIAKLYSRRKIDRERPWIDLRNGIRFALQPKLLKFEFLQFSTADGVNLYPRVQTRMMDEKSFVTEAALVHGISDGLRFRNFYIPNTEMPKLFVFKEKMDNISLFEDESGKLFFKQKWKSELHPILLEEWINEKKRWTDMVEDFEHRVKECKKTRLFRYPLPVNIDCGCNLSDYEEPLDIRITRKDKKVYNTFCRDIRLGRWKSTGSYTEIFRQAYGIRVVRNWEGKYLLRTRFFEKLSKQEDPKYDFAELLDDAYLHLIEDGKEYYVDLGSKVCFNQIPDLIQIGFVKFQKDNDMYFPLDYRLSRYIPYRRDEIVGGNDICFIGKHIVLLKNHPSAYYIRQRYSDDKRFIICENQNAFIGETKYELFYDNRNPYEINPMKQ